MTAVLEGQIPDRVYRRPIIALVGSGDHVVLSGAGTGYTLKPGSTGLGLAPHEVNTTPLAAGGSIIRSKRKGEREVFLPIDVHFGRGPGAYALLEDARRRLEHIVTDPGGVEIRLLGKDGHRSVFAEYVEGLEGSFAVADVNQVRMNISLRFTVPDPWWYGQQRGQEWALSRIAKPFVTSLQVPFLPVVIAPSVVQGAFEFTVQGDAAAQPTWTIYPPGEDLLIACHNGCGKRLFLEGPITEPVTFDARLEDITSPSMTRGELWERVSLDSEFFNLPPGTNHVAISMVGTTGQSRVELTYREKFKAGH